jgi:hypothetical protein
MSGSEVEPVAPEQGSAPEQADTQMQEATDRLRDKAWMLAPITKGAVVLPSDEIVLPPDEVVLPSEESPAEAGS